MKRIFAIMVLALTLFTVQAMAQDKVLHHWTFSGDIPAQWSEDKTKELGGDQRLGLFNNRNKRYPASVMLEMENMPVAPLTLSFDMFYVGTWDTGGDQADTFTVRIPGGPTLLTQEEFPCKFNDGDKGEMPVANDGWLKVGKKKRAWWVRPITLDIPASAIKNGKLVILFTAKLTGRKTEFWAMDNVKIIEK